jgi:hypothetical protein
MQSLTLFRILTFVLIPIAALFGFLDILVLLSALANPALLLIAFILGCFVIYTFVSLQFLTKGIDTGRPCKPGLRDWIRVNAFVSAFVGMMFLLNSLSIFFSSDASLKQLITQLLESQPNVPPMLTGELFLRIMKTVAYFMFFVSLALLVHIVLNFRFMKQYKHLFEEPVL